MTVLVSSGLMTVAVAVFVVADVWGAIDYSKGEKEAVLLRCRRGLWRSSGA
jgi:hypothetical protein